MASVPPWALPHISFLQRSATMTSVPPWASAPPWALRATSVRLNLILGRLVIDHFVIGEIHLRAQIRHAVHHRTKSRRQMLKVAVLEARVDFSSAPIEHQVSKQPFRAFCRLLSHNVLVL